jgi:glycerophosphoryl diester phosphodiesterase
VSTFTLIAKAAGSAESSENTLTAIEAALAVEPPPWARLALEIDVRLSADGVPVVIHDERLERTTNGRGLVRGHSLQQLRGLRAGARDEQIPLLEEVFSASGEHSVIVEVHDRGADTAERMLTALRRLDRRALSRAIVASEHGSVIHELRAREPRLCTAATKSEAYRKLVLSRLNVERFTPRGHPWLVPVRHAGVEVASPRFVQSARRLGDDVWVFVVDEAKELSRLRRLGVSGCFTTRPAALARELASAV